MGCLSISIVAKSVELFLCCLYNSYKSFEFLIIRKYAQMNATKGLMLLEFTFSSISQGKGNYLSDKTIELGSINKIRMEKCLHSCCHCRYKGIN